MYGDAPHTPNKHPFKPVANDPAVVAAMQRKLSKLKSDLDAIAPKAQPTSQSKTSLQQDLLDVVDSKDKPAAKPVSQLATDLADVIAKRSKPALDTDGLAHELKTVMNSTYAPPANVAKSIKRSETLLKDGGVDLADAALVTKDLKAIAEAAKAKGQAGLVK